VANCDDNPAHLDSPSPELPSRRALSPRASLQILIAEDGIFPLLFFYLVFLFIFY
jgi:hypothetical protein